MKIHVAYSISKMKTNIDALIVVEGASDVAYLSQYINSYFFSTNGYDLSKDKIRFLLEASKVRKIIILTDPDEAGEKIRNDIKNQIQGVSAVLIDTKSRKNYKKHGIAELDIKDILEALKPYISEQEIVKTKYNLSTLISLRNNPSEIREIIVEKYHLINGNNKNLESQLNILNVDKEELWKLIAVTSTK